jgi:hypothetical protein
MADEIGWQPDRDEGLRLMTSTKTLAGLRATLRLPTKYDVPYNFSYFNFYLGINFASGGACEAGVSYGYRHGLKAWRIFINPGISMIYPGAMGVMDLTLALLEFAPNAATPVLFVNNSSSIRSSVSGKLGQVKMVAAIHEDITDSSRRKTWFDEGVFACSGVIDSVQPGASLPNTIPWIPYTKVEKLTWHLQRPDTKFGLIQSSSFTGDNYRTFMKQPAAAQTPGAIKQVGVFRDGGIVR